MTTTSLSDPAVERDLIGCVLADRDVVAEIADLVEPEDFRRAETRELFEIALALDERGEVPDVTTVVGELRRRGSKIDPVLVADLAREAPAAPKIVAPSRARTLSRLAAQRALVDRLSTATEQARVDAIDPAEIAAEIASDVVDLTARRGLVAEPIGSLVASALETLEAEATGAVEPGVRTGFLGIDAKLGGLRPGWLTLVAARPGVGKTSFASAISRNVAERRRVLFFSVEMGADEVATRLLCSEAGVDYAAVRTGGASMLEWQRLAQAVEPLSAAELTIVDQPSLTVPQVRALARRTPDVGLVVVDYLQLMGGRRRQGQSRQEEIAEISRGLKVLARETGVPVLACSQLNRNTETRADRRPRLDDLRESGALEQDADVVILLHRETADAARIDAIIAKHRSGPTGTVKLSFEYEYTRFRDFTEGGS